ncbi:MAG: hypothetical protein PHN26_09175, partial [Eubacteriaceae bacterium]|nr:hypothetical protein [Eubacteriaceae bacterium]
IFEVYEDTMNINDVLMRIFSSLADSVQNRQNNVVYLVKYAAEMAVGKAPDFDNNKYFAGTYDPTYLLRSLKYTSEELTGKISHKNCDLHPENPLTKELKKLDQLRNRLSKDINNLDFAEIYQMFIDDWDCYKDCQYTYKVLMELQKLQNDADYPDDKHSLCQVLLKAFWRSDQ